MGTQPRRDVNERFWEKVEKTESCWLWRAGPHKDDLSVVGVFQLGRKATEGIIRAPLFSWLFAENERPTPGVFLCHRCDVPKCVRPDHLFLGTNADNMKDMSEKKRTRSSKIT